MGSSPKWLPARLLVSVHAVPKRAQNGTEGAVTVLRLRAIDPHRLAGAVIDELDRGLLEERGFAVQTDFELGHARRATTCSGGIPSERSAKTRMNSTPPPETMRVLKPFARR